jgi:mono/diheme cytochrome c family protein
MRRLLALLPLILPLSLQGQNPPVPRLVRPPQVTDSAVARGETLFHGSASCSTCHGVAGAGTDSAPALAQGVWMHGPDSFEGILTRVLHGVPKAYSTRDVAMPMRGWTTMSDEQARDVAAYVWQTSHGARPRSPS